MAHLILVVPCYNEQARLPVEAFRRFTLPGHRLELCFVNDGSRDGTRDLLHGLVEGRPEAGWVLDLEANQGKAEAVRQGFLAAFAKGATYVGFWDADLATPLSELPSFLEVLESQPEIQSVFGSRVKLLGRRIERRAVRHYLGRVFATAVSTALGLPIYDSQCGAKVFRRTGALETVFAEPFYSRWIFDVEIVARLLALARAGCSVEEAHLIYELPLRQWTDVSGSKLGPSDYVKAMVELWRIRRRELRGRSAEGLPGHRG